MDVLQNIGIESAERAFEVSFTQWGTERKPARTRKCIVMAVTRDGARRIIQSHFPRSGDYRITEQKQVRCQPQ